MQDNLQRSRLPVILQGNLSRCKVAQDLMSRLADEKKADIYIICEQYEARKGKNWYQDKSGTAAIWLINSKLFPIQQQGCGEGFVWISSSNTTYVSCYLSPNEGIAVFREKLQDIEDLCSSLTGDIILAGDFNAKSCEWGMTWSDTRGREVTEMAARLDLTIMNLGNSSTFRRRGYRETILDITMATSGAASRISKWEVLEDYTASDHQHISFQIGCVPLRIGKASKHSKRGTGWNVKKLDPAKLLSTIARRGGHMLDESTSTVVTKAAVERLIENTMNVIVSGCNASMPKRSTIWKNPAAYWWTHEIAELRANCFKLRRKIPRSRKKGRNVTQANRAYMDAKKTLNRAISESKRNKWTEIRNKVDLDPWGLGYQIVTEKLCGRSPVATMDPVTMKLIVEELFPKHPSRVVMEEMRLDTVPLLTKEELWTAASSMACGKAPGPDGIPTEVVKVIVKEYPFLLLNIFNACLRTGVFCKRWKKQKLVLLDKERGPPITPSSYRPLCMLDVIGKLFEKCLRARLRAAIEEAGGLASNQHGFREGRSTVGAIREIIQEIEKAWSGNHRTRSVCVMVTFDVRNAFNSVRWVDILDVLERRFKVPGYLRMIISDYLNDRWLIYETTEGVRSSQVTAGVAQGSVLGPDLWNVVYDEALTMDLPNKTRLIGFADDLAAMITARTEEQAQQLVASIAMRVENWLNNHHLQLASKKTELVVLTRQRHFNKPFIADIVGHGIEAGNVLKYLGTYIDEKLTFNIQVAKAANKAEKMVAMLSRLMPNINGPRSSKRRVLMSVANSIMLYGAEVWADALKAECRRKKLMTVQRKGALRVACAYRTVSGPAVLVIAGCIPIDLLAAERKRIYEANRMNTNKTIATQERQVTLLKWEERWKTEDRGRWTARIISEVKPWFDRRYGEVNYYVTQFLSGHGHFNAYLFRRKKKPSPYCDYCSNEVDDAEHTFFKCTRWAAEKYVLEGEIGGIMMPDNIGTLMVNSQTNWDNIAHYVEKILKQKKIEEQLRERDAQ